MVFIRSFTKIFPVLLVCLYLCKTWGFIALFLSIQASWDMTLCHWDEKFRRFSWTKRLHRQASIGRDYWRCLRNIVSYSNGTTSYPIKTCILIFLPSIYIYIYKFKSFSDVRVSLLLRSSGILMIRYNFSNLPLQSVWFCCAEMKWKLLKHSLLIMNIQYL